MPSETIADVLREMREHVKPIPYAGGDVCTIPALPATVETWADRIEAAAKRKRATLEDALSHCREYAEKIERENEEGETRLDAEEIIATVDNEFAGIRPERAPGNAAALREALFRASEELNQVYKHADMTPALRESVAETDRAALAAIAAPARNCDAIPADEMCRAFKHANCDQYENSSEDPRTCCEGRCVECIVKWMLKEHKEGGEEE